MSAQITVMRSLGPLLTKRIALGGDGKPVSDGSACRMQAGTISTARQRRFMRARGCTGSAG
jgi:hypothetical protein